MDVKGVVQNLGRTFVVWICFCSIVFAQTPYPISFEVSQIPSSLYEKTRLRQVEFFQDKFDHQLTGFYVASGKKIVVNVEVLTNSLDGSVPSIVIGTPERAGNNRKEIALKTGENTIAATAHSGGMIYFRYVSNTASTQGKIKVTFTSESEQVRAPYYIKGVTTTQEFNTMLDAYITPDVMFSSKDVVVVVSREAAITYSKATDKDAWLTSIERILLAEDRISGLSNDDPNPLHYRLANGLRHLFAESATGYMYAGNMATAYCGSAALERLLTNNQIDNNNWGLSHELGHTRQQTAYKPSNFTETTVNIYSSAVQREFKGSDWTRMSQAVWTKLHTLYFTLPDSERNFHNASITPVTGYAEDARMLLFDQLQIIFGDVFYHLLHRITREEKESPGSDEDRRGYFVLKACQITGYDLRDYFKRWGFVLNDYRQAVVDQYVADANLKKHSLDATLHLITPYSKPEGLPIPLIGITSSKPFVAPNPEDAPAAVIKYCDYSSKTGEFTDPRDGKKYPYKTYGGYDWFMKNLDWDGYDGISELTRGTVGLYGIADPTGKVYGRMYPTNSTTFSSWCPAGWTTPTESLWNEMIASIKSTYSLDETKVVPCLKCGGDQDVQSDGLWKKGAGMILPFRAAEIGFNILPAGVFNKDAGSYDSGDEFGMKASFFIPNSTWYHQVVSNSADQINYLNRNTRHHGSIRCVRKTLSTDVRDLQNTIKNRVFFDVSRNNLLIDSSASIASVFISDVMGRKIFLGQYNGNLPGIKINSQSWPNGIYLFKIQYFNASVESGKVIKN